MELQIDIEMKNTIKVQRAILNITQEELAQKIGVSRQTISSIEKNKYVPSTVLALKLSQLFEKPVNEIFELEEED
uniref:helix-turn-helix transcriptional regulator n=1 Tax=Bernardetia sp. ABR2-2B TaxID=3127472 RepID=UPI00403F7C9D